ncbi:MAG: zinc-ribbon domain-containing protein [Deltaproteobacteria bacterium]|uniref:Zinc-ribbon domain-containing protein n=1 Tax=Candidatus Zymogenus saltonus TaxID=2844893 RepID=A0A9D8PSE3_9DELT|nr:zinc-ribbon domain-containing protein [Candidatus Zymogenus saltonus]
MKVKCNNCGFEGNIADSLIPDDGKKVSCPKCKTSFVVNKKTKPLPIDQENQSNSKMTTWDYIKGDYSKLESTPEKRIDTEKEKTITPKNKAEDINKTTLFLILIISLIAVTAYAYYYFNFSIYSKYRDLKKQHPDYVHISSLPEIKTGSLTNVQKEQYANMYVGKNCIGIGEVVSVEKYNKSIVGSFMEGFTEGLTGTFTTPKKELPSSGVLIELKNANSITKIYLPENTTLNYFSLSKGQNIVFIGVIEAVSVGYNMTFHVVNVSLE